LEEISRNRSGFKKRSGNCDVDEPAQLGGVNEKINCFGLNSHPYSSAKKDTSNMEANVSLNGKSKDTKNPKISEENQNGGKTSERSRSYNKQEIKSKSTRVSIGYPYIREITSLISSMNFYKFTHSLI